MTPKFIQSKKYLIIKGTFKRVVFSLPIAFCFLISFSDSTVQVKDGPVKFCSKILFFCSEKSGELRKVCLLLSKNFLPPI